MTTIVGKKRNSFSIHDEHVFPDGVFEIVIYSMKLQNNGVIRRYIIELHKYNGFSMVKFYPKTHKLCPKRYELRGDQLGFNMTKGNVFKIMYECALIMREYLDENQNCFVGYVGQVDYKDHKKLTIDSQRSRLYNTLTDTVFPIEKYKLSSRTRFKEINLRLIRKAILTNGQMNADQIENYGKFLFLFEKNAEIHYQMMTEATKKELGF